MKRAGLWIALAAVTALADMTLIYDMGRDGKQIIRYKDASHIKVINRSNDGTEGGYLIAGDKKLMIVREGGKTQYIDMVKMSQNLHGLDAMMGQMEQAMGQGMEEESGGDMRLIKRVGSVTVAGIRGEKWIIESDGKKEEVILTKDPRVVRVMRDVARAMMTLDQTGGGNLPSDEMLLGGKYAPLSDSSMRLVKADSRTIPAKAFAVPAGAVASHKSGGSRTAVGGEPPYCAPFGPQGKPLKLTPLLGQAPGWQLLKSNNCSKLAGQILDHALYKKGNTYILVSLGINIPGNQGVVANNRRSGLKIEGYKKGRLQGFRYQGGYLSLAGQEALDIRLDGNAILELSATGGRPDLVAFAKRALNLKAYKPVAKTDPYQEMMGAQKGGPSTTDEMQQQMQKAAEMLKGLFGGM